MSVSLTPAHVMQACYHGCGDIPCTFCQCFLLQQIQLFCSTQFQFGPSPQSQTLTKYIGNVFLCMNASAFNPVNRKVLFSQHWCVRVYVAFAFWGGDDIWTVLWICCIDGLKVILHCQWATGLLEAPHVTSKLFSCSWRQIIPLHKVRQQLAMSVWMCVCLGGWYEV